jgi:hypothetical protein
MGTAPGRDPLPFGQIEANRDLVRQLLRLLHHAGMVPAQLAQYRYVPYDVLTLNRFLSGEALPPPDLVETIVELCDGDRPTVQAAYERALRVNPSHTGYPAPPYAGGAWSAERHGHHQQHGHRQYGYQPQHGYELPMPPPRVTATPVAAPATTAGGQAGARTGGHAAGSKAGGRQNGSGSDRSRRVLRSRVVSAAVGFSAVSAVAITTTLVALNAGGGAGDPAAAATRERDGGADLNGGANPNAAPALPSSSVTPSPPPSPLEAPAPGPPQRGANSAELISNGGFTTATTGDWWPSDNVTLGVDDGRLQVDVAKGSGRDHWDAMVMQALPRVELGKEYALTFQAAGKSSTAITVSVQREMDNDAPTLLSEKAKLTTKMTTFSFRFTAEEALNPPAICFQVGGHPKGQTLWLDGISLTEAGPAD